MKPNPIWRRCGMWGVVFALAAITSQGGFLPPLYVGNLQPVRDEYGRAMRGSHLPSGVAGRSFVELRTSTDGIIRPPSTNGAAHPYNPLLPGASIGGSGLNASAPNSGLFCMALSNRPSAGTPVFARVYNAPTVAEASFYADSSITSSPVNGPSLVLVFGAAKPLDPGDADGDGLNNSWEKALGIDDRPTADYDGDGMSDLNEMLAGTAPDDPDSKLAFRLVRRESTPQVLEAGAEATCPLRVKWQSVPGKKYQLEYVLQLIPDPATGEPNLFIPVGDVVTAGDGEFEIETQVGISDAALTGTFRVKLVPE